MSQKKLVNLTLIIVKEEIENYKLINRNSAKQKTIADREVVQELLAYVLSHIPNIYVAATPQEIEAKYRHTGKSLEQRMQIERLIDRAIKSIMAARDEGQSQTLTVCQN